MPKELGGTDFERVSGKYKISLMWKMTKPLWGTGKTLIIDSGLYVLNGFIVM